MEENEELQRRDVMTAAPRRLAGNNPGSWEKETTFCRRGTNPTLEIIKIKTLPKLAINNVGCEELYRKNAS